MINILKKLEYFPYNWGILVLRVLEKGVKRIMTYLEELQRERDGFKMLNRETNVEITCTEKFVKFWQQRGFEVVDHKVITLM